jgi:hypothetical protein
MLETRRWWKDDRVHFESFTSQAVLSEAGRGDPIAAAERLQVIDDLRLVPVTDGAAALADFLIKRGALPAKARVDALHLAIAAANGIDGGRKILPPVLYHRRSDRPFGAVHHRLIR